MSGRADRHGRSRHARGEHPDQLLEGSTPATAVEPMMSTMHQAGPARRPLTEVVQLAAWTGALALVVRVLHSSGGSLRVPSDSWDSAGAWLRGATPVELAGALLRLGAIAAAWYLLGVTVLAVVAYRAGWQGLARAAARITPAVVQRIAVRGGGVGLAIGTLVSSGLPAATGPAAAVATHAGAPRAAATGSSTVVMTVVPDHTRPGAASTGTSTVVESTAAGAVSTMSLLLASATPTGDADGTATMSREPSRPATPGEATMTRLPDADPAPGGPMTTGAPATGAPATSAPAGEPPAGTPAPDAPATDTPLAPAVGTGDARPRPTEPTRPDGPSRPDDTWRVAPGESFWSIAADVVTKARGGRAASDREIAGYWRALITANRDRLVVPADPDVLVPGQELAVPAPPPPPSDDASPGDDMNAAGG